MSIGTYDALNAATQNSLRSHLGQIERQIYPVNIGSLSYLKTVVKISDSKDIAEAIRLGNYPSLLERQCLIACIREVDGSDVRVWGIYNKEQILQMKGLHLSHDLEWKILEISAELEAQLRTTSTPGRAQPKPPVRTCVLL